MSLTEKLDAIRAGAVDRLPAETLALLSRCTNDLRATGILDRVLGVGAALPDFDLPDSGGTMVASSALLAEGPLVVSFYRGLW